MITAELNLAQCSNWGNVPACDKHAQMCRFLKFLFTYLTQSLSTF